MSVWWGRSFGAPDSDATPYYRARVDDLVHVAHLVFGLEVRAKLPIHESFSSAVLSFVAVDDRHYIVKRPWNHNKAIREAEALRSLEEHLDVPALLATGEHDGTTYLLIEGLDGEPWGDVGSSSPDLLREVGRSMRGMHATAAESFDGQAGWHDLLAHNADRYLAVMGDQDDTLANNARMLLDRHLEEVPEIETPQLVHFDLRPGNVLVRDGGLVALIDFESCRGGHGSMDFFKLWQQVAPFISGGLADIVAGYVEDDAQTAEWLEADHLDRLMRIYSAYHGLAGLAWCYTRNDFSGTFPDVNRELMYSAIKSFE